MRVISGIVKGTKLETLEGKSTRPTLDRVKEALFNILQIEVQDATVLDLFSGSGALGIESLSRGAKFSIMCDKSNEAIEIIKRNVKKTHFEEKVKIIKNDYKKAINILQDYKFDLIFIDPPYDANIGIEAIKDILKLDLLRKMWYYYFRN